MHPQPPWKDNSSLGYLAAFTLGIICMAAVVLVMRPSNLPVPSRQKSLAESFPEDKPRTFAQRNGGPAPKDTRAGRGTQVKSTFQRQARVLEGPTHTLESPSEEASASFEPIADAVPQRSEPETRDLQVLPIPRVAGMLSGRAVFNGNPPPEKPIPLSAQCAEVNPGLTTRFYVVSENQGLADVVVFISAGLPNEHWPAARNPVRLSYTGCEIQPYVNAIQIGQELIVENLDRMMHNIHFTPKEPGNRELNLAMIPGGKPAIFSIGSPELSARIKCDLHPWEFSYISAFDHPFFGVTDRNGIFHMPMPPDREYVLTAVHRKNGSIEQRIRVQDGGFPEIIFSFILPADLQANSAN